MKENEIRNGDLVVYDNGWQFVIGIWSNGIIICGELEWIFSPFGNDESLKDHCKLLQCSFEPYTDPTYWEFFTPIYDFSTQ